MHTFKNIHQFAGCTYQDWFPGHQTTVSKFGLLDHKCKVLPLVLVLTGKCLSFVLVSVSMCLGLVLVLIETDTTLFVCTSV